MTVPQAITPGRTAGVHQKKRIIVCCDGTWVDADNGYDEKTHSLKTPSNVARFVRSLHTESWPEETKTAVEGAPNIPQISYYQAGVGTGANLTDQLSGGATGEGIDENIREAYSFVARNWVHNNSSGDDELYFLGFSRGAFTARCIVGLISTVGLLTKRGMDFFPEIFKDYENMNVEQYKNPLAPTSALKGKPSLFGQQGTAQKSYFDYLRNPPAELGLGPLTSEIIPVINAIGVWDTVGSLGIPGIAVIDEIKEKMGAHVYRKELQFYDTSISNNVQNAFQALALDEQRYSFIPCLWEKTGDTQTNLKQVWFPGVHSNIGGGMDDIELSDITLAWMLSQFEPFLDFDHAYISSSFLLNKKRSQAAKTERPWACGNIDTIHNNAIYKVSGFRIRTPGQYRKIDPEKGTETEDPLENTHERIHPSARLRLAKTPNTFGINDVGPYLAEALTPQAEHFWTDFLGNKHHARSGWKLVQSDPAKPLGIKSDFEGEDLGTGGYYWKRQTAAQGRKEHEVLPEEPLGFWEKKLLETQVPAVDLGVMPKGWGFGESKL